MQPTKSSKYDVVVIGAGIAGLTLCRHLLLYTDKTILLLDRRKDPPKEAPQKYGESLVQCSAYYFSKVLDLEEYLMTEHYMKYNLRFYWPTEGLDASGLENYSQSFIRTISNIPTYQLDRNRLEEHLLAINTENPRCEFLGGTKDVKVDLSTNGDLHRVSFAGGEVSGRWVVDASGRGKVLGRQMNLSEKNAISHGASFFWVEGLVNVEKLTNRSLPEILYDPQRRKLGHFPQFLGTDHFCAEGQWFWVIPLHHKTSLGLVYERRVIDGDEVATPQKVIDYVCRTWPLFARDLPNRKILDHGRIADFSYGCKQTISADRWALVGEAGRFTDPLYSPGGDLISIYNSLIAAAISADDPATLEAQCELAEVIERAMYEAYVPSYATSYDCLGDQEAFTLKYTWELAIYFGFFVFPMMNGLFTNPAFMRPFLRRFGVLGPINSRLQQFLSGFFHWKKAQPKRPLDMPALVDFYEIAPLRESEKLFYEAGLGPTEALDVVDQQLERMQEFARYIQTHIFASVLSEPAALTNAPFIRSLSLKCPDFDPEQMKAAYAPFAGAGEEYSWNLNPLALQRFINDGVAPLSRR